jgi:crossover junction endodeoxyribonuclease RuvC
MGIDPGLVATGWGCLERRPGNIRVLAAGVITTPPRAALGDRLQSLYTAVRDVLAIHAPAVLMVEDLYAEYEFPRTAIMMGHARGVICLAAAQQGVAVFSLAPAEVKRVFALNGGASKEQVQRGVQRVLGLPEPPRPSHVADALGLAYTGLARGTERRA